MNDWISCNDRHPEIDQIVLGCDDDNRYQTYKFDGKDFISLNSGFIEPIYWWLPIPTHPRNQDSYNILRKKLDSLDLMEFGEAAIIVTEVLKYLMDNIK